MAGTTRARQVDLCGSTSLLLGGERTKFPSEVVSCATSAIIVRVSIQRTCRSVHKRRTLWIKGSSKHEMQCRPPHIKNSLCCLTASAPQYVGKRCKTWGNETLLPEAAKISLECVGYGAASQIAAIGGNLGRCRALQTWGQRPATSLVTIGCMQ